MLACYIRRSRFFGSVTGSAMLNGTAHEVSVGFHVRLVGEQGDCVTVVMSDRVEE